MKNNKSIGFYLFGALIIALLGTLLGYTIKANGEGQRNYEAITRIDERLDRIDNRIEKRFDKIDATLEKIEAKLEK